MDEEDKKRDNLQCLCCHELMVSPTTLGCGHSYCRLCLTLWFKRSKKVECMICKKEFGEVPAVSYTIRSLTESFFKEEYQSRCEELDTPENRELIQEFEKAAKRQSVGDGPPIQRAKWIRYTAAGFLLLVGYLAYLLTGLIFQSDPITSKPVNTWSNGEVVQWLREQGMWTGPMVKHVQDLSIDGHLLVTLAKSPVEMERLVKDLDPLYQKAFTSSLQSTVDLNVKPPQDFWEYKTLHLFTIVAMVTIAPAHPRLFLLLTYLLNYRQGFLPLIHRVCPVFGDIDVVYLYSYQFPHPTLSQLLDFMWKAMFLPHFLVYWQFLSWTLFYTNYLMFVYLSFILLLNTYRDVKEIQHYVEHTEAIGQYFEQLLQQWKDASIILFPLYIFWVVVPTFVINCYLFFVCFWIPGKKYYQFLKHIIQR